MIEIVVSTHTDFRDRLDVIVESLREAGLREIEVSRRFGLIMGTADPGAIDTLRGVDGVKSVREGDSYAAQDPESAGR